MKLTFLIFIFLNLLSCSTSVNINTEPSGYDIYVEGQNIGKSPTAYSFSDSIFKDNIIEFKKNGKIIRKYALDREVKVPSLIGCFACLIPCIWVVGPKPYQNIELETNIETEKIKNKAILIFEEDLNLSISIGNKKIRKNKINIIEPGDHDIQLCDETKCSTLSHQKFETNSIYIYHLENKFQNRLTSLN